MKKLLIASDHAGYKLKESLKAHLAVKYEIIDLGTDSEASVDYPDFGIALAKSIQNKQAESGILVCGSGVGISIAANRNPAARAVVVYNEETAQLSRQHNDANIAVFGSRLIDEAYAIKLADIFLSTAFEGGRHEKRVQKLSC